MSENRKVHTMQVYCVNDLIITSKNVNLNGVLTLFWPNQVTLYSIEFPEIP